VLPTPPSQAFPLYVWEVLSVSTTPARRDAAFNALKRVPALTPDSLGRVPRARIEAAVGLAGPMKDERLRAIRAGVELFKRNPTLADAFAGPIRQALREASRVPHLGRASALRLLLFAGGHPVLPLDEAALRVARRLGYGVGAGPPARVLRTARAAITSEIQRDVETLRGTAIYLTHHGLATCVESNPHCSVCPLLGDCPFGRSRLDPQLN
jgi:endonuclease III